MGYEFTIKVSPVENDTISTMLISLPHYQGIKHFDGRVLYEYRLADNQGDMPNAIAEIEAEGIYFCDNGHGAHILEELIKTIKEQSLTIIKMIDHSN